MRVLFIRLPQNLVENSVLVLHEELVSELVDNRQVSLELCEFVHIQLSFKRGILFHFKELWDNLVGKGVHVMNDETFTAVVPGDDVVGLWILDYSVELLEELGDVNVLLGFHVVF